MRRISTPDSLKKGRASSDDKQSLSDICKEKQTCFKRQKVCLNECPIGFQVDQETTDNLRKGLPSSKAVKQDIDCSDFDQDSD